MSGPICTCKQYNTECDEYCNCCDSPYRQFECDCECKDRKATEVAQILGELIKNGVLEQIAHARDEKTFVGTEKATARVDEMRQKLADQEALGYDYGEAVNAPLDQDTIDALNEKLASGDYPRRKVKPIKISERDEINEETEYGQQSDEPLTDLQRQFVDALDKDSAQRETIIVLDASPSLKIRKRTTSEILEYMASNIEKQADYYNQHQLIMLLRMIADKIKEERGGPDQGEL